MFYSASRKILPWIMDNLIRDRRIPPEVAPELVSMFDHNRHTFNELVSNMCQYRNVREADTEMLKEATLKAIFQLYQKIRNRNSYAPADCEAWGSSSLESFYQPQNRYDMYAPPKDHIADINDRTYNMFNQSKAPEYSTPNGNKSANGLFYEEPSNQQPQQQQYYQPNEPERQKSPAPIVEPKKEASGAISYKFMSLESVDQMTTEEKLYSRISGSTRQKIDNGTFKLNRQVITIKNSNGEALNIKYDHMNLCGSNLMFDSHADVSAFLSGQMSREDIDKMYFRVTEFYILKQLDVDHDLFFREKERLDEVISAKNLDSTKELYDNLEVLLQCYNIFKTLHIDYVTAMEKFLTEEINDFMKMYLRIGNQPKRIIACESIKDLDEFLKDSKFASFRNIESFEIMMNQLLKNLINHFHGDGDSMFFNFDSTWQNVYTKTRKYITLSSALNGLNSMDYYQYTPELQQIMNQEIKKKVLIGIPCVNITTNCYNPGFIKRTVASMRNTPQLIPNDLVTTDFDNFLYIMIYEQVDKQRRIPNKMLYATNEHEMKTLGLNYSLDGLLIID